MKIRGIFADKDVFEAFRIVTPRGTVRINFRKRKHPRGVLYEFDPPLRYGADDAFRLEFKPKKRLQRRSGNASALRARKPGRSHADAAKQPQSFFGHKIAAVAVMKESELQELVDELKRDVEELKARVEKLERSWYGFREGLAEWAERSAKMSSLVFFAVFAVIIITGVALRLQKEDLAVAAAAALVLFVCLVSLGSDLRKKKRGGEARAPEESGSAERPEKS